MSGCNYSFIIEKGNSLNGWLQLDLWINSIPMKKGMTESACLKEHNTIENTRLLQVASWIMVVPLKCMAATAPLK